MKKIIISVVFILVAIALIAPKFVGTELANGIEDIVKKIDDNPSYTASVKSINTSWFTTQSVVSVGLQLPEMPELENNEPINMQLDFDVNAHHGPFIVADGINLGWTKLHIQSITDNLPEQMTVAQQKAVYELKGLTGLFGNTHYTDNIAAFTYTTPEAIIDFSGMQGEGTLSSNSLAYKGELASLDVDVSEQANLGMKNVMVDFSVEASFEDMITQGLYDSDSSFSIGMIRYDDLINTKQTRIENLLMKATSYLKEDIGGIEVNTSLESISAPDFTMSDLKAVIEMKNLQASFLRAYQKYSSEILENMSDTEQFEMHTEAFMQEHLLAQLQQEPEYNLSQLSGLINDSPFNGKVMAKIAGVTQLPAALEDTAFWMQHAVIDSQLELEKGAAEFVAYQLVSSQLAGNPQLAEMSPEEIDQIIEQQIPNTLNALAQQGMIVIDGESYTSRFTLKEGEAKLNGNPIPL